MSDSNTLKGMTMMNSSLINSQIGNISGAHISGNISQTSSINTGVNSN